MAKITHSKNKQFFFILQNDLSYSVNDYLGSNSLTHFKTNKQKLAQHNMNLAYQGVYLLFSTI